MPSVLWAGPRSKSPIRMSLAARLESIDYQLALGLSTDRPFGSAFSVDPAVKEESLAITNDSGRSTCMMERKGRSAWLRDQTGARADYRFELLESESLLSQLREPHRFPELSALRYEFAQWRFYHQFRTDEHAPIRHPQAGALTPVLSHDGHDLAVVLATCMEQGRQDDVMSAVADAFRGARLVVDADKGRFSVGLETPGIARSLQAQELSDGTLRYLCLVAALLSTRPPELVALNEPETSLHPDLLEPLARLIVEASRTSQVWLTTHSRLLAERIANASGEPPIELAICDGETKVVHRDVDEDDAA